MQQMHPGLSKEQAAAMRTASTDTAGGTDTVGEILNARDALYAANAAEAPPPQAPVAMETEQPQPVADPNMWGGPSAMMMQAPMGAPPVPGPSQGPMQALALLGMQGSQPIFMPMGPEDPRNLQQLPNGSMMHISPWDNAQRMYVPHSYLNPPLNMSTYTSAAAPAQLPMQVPQPPPPQPMQPPPVMQPPPMQPPPMQPPPQPVPITGMLPPGMLPPGMMPPSSMAMGGMAMSSMGMVMGAGPAWHAPYPLQEGPPPPAKEYYQGVPMQKSKSTTEAADALALLTGGGGGACALVEDNAGQPVAAA